jgi:hypothetical protein
MAKVIPLKNVRGKLVGGADPRHRDEAGDLGSEGRTEVDTLPIRPLEWTMAFDTSVD